MKASSSRTTHPRPVLRRYEQRYFNPDDIGVRDFFVPIGAGLINSNVKFYLEGEVDVTVQAIETFGGDGSSGLTLYLLCADDNDVFPAFTDAIQVLPQGSFCGTLVWGANTFSLERAGCGVVRKVQILMSNDFPAADDALVTMKLFTRARATSPGVRFAA